MNRSGVLALAVTVAEAKVWLETGLFASEREGGAISRKFEVEERKLQLSVDTTKGGTFSEVILDHKTVSERLD